MSGADVIRAMLGSAVLELVRVPDLDLAIAVRRLTEPEWHRERTLAHAGVYRIDPRPPAATLERAALRRLVWYAAHDAATIDDAAPRRLFASVAEVREFDSQTFEAIAAAVLEHQRPLLDLTKLEAIDGALERELGPIGRVRAEYARDLVAFYGCTSALFDLTNDQVVAWWRLRSLTFEHQAKTKPESEPRREPSRRVAAKNLPPPRGKRR